MTLVNPHSGKIRASVFAVLLLAFTGWPAAAQETTQFWPEIDAYVKLNQQFRVYLMTTTTKEAGNAVGSEMGANLDVFVKPLVKLKHFTGFRLDESKSRLMSFRIGYRNLSAPGESPEHRIVLEATQHYPLARGVTVSNRNRADLRWVSGASTWRYRSQLTLEKGFRLWTIRFTPYARAEIYYDSAVRKFNRTTVDGGVIFPIRWHIELEPYYEHMNDTSKAPNRQTNAIGLTLSLYFQVKS